MRLPTFIIDNIDQIVAEWKNAALPATLPLESQAKQIMMAVAADIESGATLTASSAAVTMRTVLRNAPETSSANKSVKRCFCLEAGADIAREILRVRRTS